MITEIFAPVNFPIDGPEIGPIVIFKGATPDYLKDNFLKWCEIGLAEVGVSRQLENKIIKHLQTEFIGLIDALYCGAVREADDKFEERVQRYYASYYKKEAKGKEILNPAQFCLAFFQGITPESAKSVLWLLLATVTADKEKYRYHIEQKAVLNLYERYALVIDLGNEWYGEMKN